jgi:hypothetical protein
MTKPVQRKKAQVAKSTAKSASIASSSQEPKELNPKTKHYEFGGPIGAVGMIVILPILVLFFATCCDATGYPAKAFLDDWQSFLLSKLTKDFLFSLYDPSAFAVYVGYVAILALFYVILPGDNIPGTVLRDGTKYKYRMNGKLSIIQISHHRLIQSLCFIGFASFHTLLFAALYFLKDSGLKPLEYVYDHFVGLAFASIIFSYAISIAVYIGSFAPDKLLALGGNTGNAVYDVRNPYAFFDM